MKHRKKGGTSKTTRGAKKAVARPASKKRPQARTGSGRAAKPAAKPKAKKTNKTRKRTVAVSGRQTRAADKYGQPGAPWWKAYL